MHLLICVFGGLFDREMEIENVLNCVFGGLFGREMEIENVLNCVFGCLFVPLAPIGAGRSLDAAGPAFAAARGTGPGIFELANLCFRRFV